MHPRARVQNSSRSLIFCASLGGARIGFNSSRGLVTTIFVFTVSAQVSFGSNLPFMCEFAGLWRALVVDEATPSGVLFDAEVSLRTLEECAPIEAWFRRGGVIVRRTTHHRNQLQEPREARIVGPWFRMHHVSQGLITLSFESRPIHRKIMSGHLRLGYISELTSKVTRQHRSVEASEGICAGDREAQALSYLCDPDPYEQGLLQHDLRR
jgi:hypothetical protein